MEDFEHCIASFVAVTNYHKCILLQSEGKKSKMGLQVCVSSGGSSEESVSLPFPASRGHLPSLACALCPPPPSFCCYLLSLTLTLLLLTYNDPCDYIGPTWIIPDSNLPILISLT